MITSVFLRSFQEKRSRNWNRFPLVPNQPRDPGQVSVLFIIRRSKSSHLQESILADGLQTHC